MTFQFKLFANNATKFTSRGNRTLLNNFNQDIGQFSYIIQPGNVFFVLMIFMDSDSKLGMNLIDTYFVTENAHE